MDRRSFLAALVAAPLIGKFAKAEDDEPKLRVLYRRVKIVEPKFDYQFHSWEECGWERVRMYDLKVDDTWVFSDMPNQYNVVSAPPFLNERGMWTVNCHAYDESGWLF